MKWHVLLILCVLNLGNTQEFPSTTEFQTQEDVARLIREARGEVLLAAPSVYSRTLAEALREVIVVRGVDVYLLVSPSKVEDRAAYAMSLQLAGARVRLVEVTESYLVIDREQTMSGSTLAMAETTSISEDITHSSDSSEVAQAVTRFYESFQAAPVYKPVLPDMRREP